MKKKNAQHQPKKATKRQPSSLIQKPLLTEAKNKTFNAAQVVEKHTSYLNGPGLESI